MSLTTATSETEIRLGSVQTAETCLYAKLRTPVGGCNVLVDTGSPVSILSQAKFRELGFSATLLTKYDVKLVSAAGKRLTVKGQATIEFKMGYLSFQQTFVVVELDGLDGIIGIDFLNKYDGSIQVRRQTLRTNQGKVKLVKLKTYSCSHIRIGCRVKVPALSEKLLVCQADRPLSSLEGLVEPTKQSRNKGILVARSLVKPQAPSIIVSVVNLGEKELSLEPNTVVGRIQAVTSVVEVDIPDRKGGTESELSELGGMENRDVATQCPGDSKGKQLPEHLKPIPE